MQPTARFFGHKVDHIFYRGLDLLDSRAVPVTSSDHDPLMATFRLAERTEARAAQQGCHGRGSAGASQP